MNRLQTLGARAGMAVAAVFLFAQAGAAQSRFYARVSAGTTELRSPAPRFPEPRDTHGSVAMGIAVSERNSIEFRRNRFHAQTTEPSPGGGETPTTAGITGSTTELGFVHRMPLFGTRLQARAGLGVTRVSFSSRYRSDTNSWDKSRTRVNGLSPSLAMAFRVAGPVTVVARSAYLRVGGRDAQYLIGVNGYRHEVGLELNY